MSPLVSKINNRPKISIYVGMSIDGYIARKDGNIDWHQCIYMANEDFGFEEFLFSVDAIVLGKNTYEVVCGFNDWPYKGKRVIVLSNTLKAVREEAELFCGDLHRLTSDLHADGIKHVWVDGGITVSQFLNSHLVDYMTLSVIPVVLGSGIPLFNAINNEYFCHLIASKPYPTGLVKLSYALKES